MYKSTRDVESKLINVSEAIINGIASDGGLYIIDKIPNIEINQLINLSYQELATKIMSLYLNDFKYDDINKIVNQAYDNKFDEGILKLKSTKDCSFLELYHGRTCAFKDMALSVLPLLLKKSKEINNVESNTIILAATSGDTGSAALSGFQNIEGIKIVVIYPNSGVSVIQEKQMLSFSGDNAKVIAINGNFDDAQNLVKRTFLDQNLVSVQLSSANSINIGRLIPQIVYYFWGYLEMVRNKQIKLNEQINYVVPTGNFGNILAGYMAKRMGLPINKLICASNKNNVLTDFFNNGLYNKNREFIKTISPSMDILISSNLERLLYYISGSSSKTKEFMNSLKENGEYFIDDEMKHRLNDFVAYFASDDETLEAIKEIYIKDNYLIDTHTAVAYVAYKKYLLEKKDNIKTIIVSTASPFKFPKAVCKALGINTEEKDDLKLINILENYTSIKAPKGLTNLPNKEKTIWIEKNTFNNKIEKLLKEMDTSEL